MLPLNPTTDLDVMNVVAVAVYKTGKIVYTDGSEEKSITINPALARPIVNTLKTTKFPRGLPLSMLKIFGEVVSVSRRALIELLRQREADDVVLQRRVQFTAEGWTSREMKLVTAVQRQASRHPARKWYFDGCRIFNVIVPEAVSVVSPGIEIVEIEAINLRSSSKETETGFLLDLAAGRAMRYVHNGVPTAPVSIVHSTLVTLALSEKDTSAASLRKYLESMTPTVGYLLRSALVWGDLYGTSLVRKLPLAQLLVHFGVTTLFDMPTRLRDVAPTGLSLVNMLAFNLGLCNRARTVAEAAALQATLQSLLSGGTVDVRKVSAHSMYATGVPEGSTPELYSVKNNAENSQNT